MGQARQSAGVARMVACRDRLHRRGLQARGQTDFRPRCLVGNMRRAIEIREGEVFDAEAFKVLIQAAVTENLRSRAAKSQGTGRRRAGRHSGRRYEFAK